MQHKHYLRIYYDDAILQVRCILKGKLFLTEAGVMILDKSMNLIIAMKYPKNEEVQSYLKIESGEIEPWLRDLISKAVNRGFKTIMIREDPLRNSLAEERFNVDYLMEKEYIHLQDRKLKLMIKVKWTRNEDEAKRIIREFALELSKVRLRELAAKPDLQVIQSVQAMEEVDRIINILQCRVKEWYGLHFPELEMIFDDLGTYVNVVLKFGRKEKITNEGLMSMGLETKKIEELCRAVHRSKGSDLRDEDMQRISDLSEESIRLSNVRDHLAKHIERTMKRIAPNITSVAGPTIGARLIAKAGGLEKIASLPSSTIQVLGAEKALFRALRSGTRPPKHGILFQHQTVHSAPKWQRGKIARSLAAKLAIAARIDVYRGTLEEGFKDGLEKRLKEIRLKYSKPPKKLDTEKSGKKIEN